MSLSKVPFARAAEADPASPLGPRVAPSFGRDARLAVLAGAVVLAAMASGKAWLIAIGIGVAAGLSVTRMLRSRRHPSRAIRALGIAGIVCSGAALTAGVVVAVWFGPQTALAVGGAYVVTLAAITAGLRRAARVWRTAAPRRGMTLSVGIICCNEADRLPACLNALRGWPDEMVILDSGSSDATVEIARHATHAVFETDWPGDGVQKQRVVDRCTGDWVLLLDADEVASDDFRRDVDAAIASHSGFAAYDFPWVHVVFGDTAYFGAVGHRFTRLFRRGAVRFGHEALHAVPTVSGATGSLDGTVFHDTYRDFAHLLRKHEEYAWSIARTRHSHGSRVTAAGVVVRTLFAFPAAYVVKLGMLDGARGLVMAVAHAAYTFSKYAALWSLGQAHTRGDRTRSGP